MTGAGPSTERFFCSYGLDERLASRPFEAGLTVSARDTTGSVRVAELPGHPYFLGSHFQPELASDPTSVHPLIGGFLAAVRTHAAARTTRWAAAL